VYPCLTYRPETVYGAVNVWVKPDYEYLVAEVDGELWVLGEYGARELADQKHAVKVVGRVRGRDLVGRWVLNPVTGWRIPVLPALFVEPDQGTGVVMSVPAHAPYDYAALLDLKKGLASEYGLDREVVEAVKPVPIIKLEGYGEVPAATVVEKLGVESQLDRRSWTRRPARSTPRSSTTACYPRSSAGTLGGRWRKPRRRCWPSWSRKGSR
jgi:leucyl-tRNA synthetase